MPFCRQSGRFAVLRYAKFFHGSDASQMPFFKKSLKKCKNLRKKNCRYQKKAYLCSAVERITSLSRSSDMVRVALPSSLTILTAYQT